MKKQNTKFPKTLNIVVSKLAIVSITLPFLAIFGLITLQIVLGECCVLYRIINTSIFVAAAVSAIVVGIFAILKIRKSEGTLKGKGLSITSIVTATLFLHFGLVMLPRIRGISHHMICRSNLAVLGKAVLIYTHDNNGCFPTPSNWCDLLIEYTDVIEGNLKCGASFLPTFSYGFNKNLDGLKIDDVPPDTIIVFEIKGGRNISGGPELMIEKKHGDQGSNVLCADISVRSIKKGNKEELNWKVK